MPAHRKRFCRHGHDTDVCGRLPSGQCRECRNALFRRRRRRARVIAEAQQIREKIAFVEAREAEARLLGGRERVQWIWPGQQHA